MNIIDETSVSLLKWRETKSFAHCFVFSTTSSSPLISIAIAGSANTLKREKKTKEGREGRIEKEEGREEEKIPFNCVWQPVL